MRQAETELDETLFAQQGYRCKLEWGRRGARDAAERGDMLVIVDVLSFSSAVVFATARGASVYPCGSEEQARSAADIYGGEVAVSRQDVPAKGRYSLSPQTYLDVPADTRVFLVSPNGAACASYVGPRKAPFVIIGALLNAQAVGQVVARLLIERSRAVTVLACGERWWTCYEAESPRGDEEEKQGQQAGELRFALEDYLGAGAILAAIRAECKSREQEMFSPEARACLHAFEAIHNDLAEVVWECGSGRELRAKGYAEDVTLAARLNAYTVVPYVSPGRFIKAFPDSHP